MPLVRIGIHKRLIYIFQVILYLIIGGADDGLEAESPNQRDAAGHFFRVHLGEGFVQYDQPYGGASVDFGR